MVMIYHDFDGQMRSKSENTLDDLPETVKKAVETLKKHKNEFDCIVVQGMSGVVVGVPVSLALKKPLVIVRKEEEYKHSHGRKIVNLNHLQGRWLFFDDFIASGRTLERCKEAVKELATNPVEFVGQFTYRFNEFWPVPEDD